MKRGSVAIVGAAESTDMGLIKNLSQTQIHCDAALNAMQDAGLESGRNVVPERFGVSMGAGAGGQDFVNFVALVGTSTAADTFSSCTVASAKR